ncbi:MAG: DUF47 family protein [Candidatus Heimdallarchaeota archaeon]|nr:DUF47 family protein [Candidatus Heimdallarchaeota archaeon]
MVYQKTNGNSVEKKVLDIILDHTRVVLNGVEVLAQIIGHWKTPGRTKFNKDVNELNSLESKANSIKNDAMKEISDAGPALLFRQDLMRIIRCVDQIIDLAQGAAYFLEQLDVNWLPPENFVNNIQGLIDKNLIAAKEIINLVRSLYQSLDRVIEIAEKIEITENNADSNYRALIYELAHIDAPRSITYLVRESIDRIEDMVDAARDVAQNLRMYAMSR